MKVFSLLPEDRRELGSTVELVSGGNRMLTVTTMVGRCPTCGRKWRFVEAENDGPRLMLHDSPHCSFFTVSEPWFYLRQAKLRGLVAVQTEN